DQHNAEVAAREEGEGYEVQAIEWDGESTLEDLDEEFASEVSRTKFSKYTLPGGENYREILFRLPHESNFPDAEVDSLIAKESELKERSERIGGEVRENAQAMLSAFKKSKISEAQAASIRKEVSYAVNGIKTKEVSEGYLSDLREKLGKKKAAIAAFDKFVESMKEQKATFDEHYKVRNRLQEIDKADRGTYYKSSHWEETNVLAHTRLKDYTDADGKKVLLVEEIQSDWHQDGRKKGYQSDPLSTDVLPKDFKVEEKESGRWHVIDADGKLFATGDNEDGARNSAINRINDESRGTTATPVPDAPFKKTWHEFVMKRLIRMAAEKGYDKIAWTPGEAQADRYSLAKQVDQIAWKKTAEGQVEVTPVFKGSGGTPSEMIIKTTADNLGPIENMFGKDIAQKIKDDVSDSGVYKGNDYTEGTLNGDNLKVGGEGMKGFYDKILVDFTNKFVKKFGARVGETNLSTLPEITDEDSKLLSDLGVDGTAKNSAKVHSLEITPQLKDAALTEGFSLFQGQPQSPRGQITFKANRKVRIDLFQAKDPSTFIHESGHLWLEELIEDATLPNASEQLKTDLHTVLNWMGLDHLDVSQGAHGIKAFIKVEHHEKFARAFEAYAMEGKSPSASLRKVFAAFKVWLTNTYKSIRNLDVEITPEIRQVMDRLVATDEQLAQAYQSQNIEQLPLGDGPYKMPPAKFKAYAEAIVAAQIAADEELTRRVMEDYAREQKAFYREKKAEVKLQIEKAANDLPVYKAISIFKDGVMPDGSALPPGIDKIKLSRKAILDSYGPEVLKKMPRGTVAAKGEDGLHPDSAAELIGFKSGKNMIEIMTASQSKKEYIEAQTDAKMQELYPDILKTPEISDEAMLAIHNDNQALKIRLELEHLASNDLPVLTDAIKRVAKRVPTEKMVRDQAQRIISQKKVEELQPHLYQRAEARAAKEAGVLLSKGDIDGAFEAKRKELLNHEIYREASKAKKEVEKTLEKFDRVAKADQKLAKTRDMDLINAARSILSMHGIGDESKPPSSYLTQMQQYDPDTFSSIMSMVTAASENAGPYKQITYDDFITLKDTVDTLWDLAKSQKEIEIDGQKLNREEVTQELMARLSEVQKPGERAGLKRAASEWDKTKMHLLGLRAGLTRMISWANAVDGNEQIGVFRKYFVHPVQEATTRYRTEKLKYLTKFMDMTKKHAKGLSQEKINAQELDYEFQNKAELLGALLHT
ncbi:MAG: hypothetical protein H0X02_07535, partial [Nitrosomonas sp.]|nr:hypothetical protein [Nitrosomonas sp.]